MPKALRLVALLGGAIITAPALAEDADLTALQQQVEQMQAQIDALEEAAQPEASQDGIHVGAYAFYDEIPSKASTYLGNVAYRLPVQFGPVTDLTFYNDYSYVTDKTGGLSDTWMNSTGVAITAGGLFSYVEVVNAKNQPFIGGSMGNPDDKHNTRYNINVGYYF